MIVRVNGDLRFIGAVVIFRVKVSFITSVNGIKLWLLFNKVAISLVLCQLSSDVIGCEDS